MAQFPTSVKSFTARSNGQTIDATHVGDLQDEVNAIEDGYLNGGARLNSSNSTLANLSVPGKSTVAQLTAGASTLASLQVTGASTLTGNVTVAGALTVTGSLVLPPPHFVILTGSTSQYANNSSGSVTWPTQTAINNSSLHSTGTNPDRVSPQSTGLYAFSVSVTLTGAFADPSTGTLDLRIKDSSGGSIGFTRVDGSAGGRAPNVAGYALKHFDALGGYLRAVLIQRGGSTNSLDGTLSFARFHKF